MTKLAEELRDCDDDELETRLDNARKELFNLRFQVATGRLDNVARIGQVRKQVACILTVQRDREIRLAEGLEPLVVAPSRRAVRRAAEAAEAVEAVEAVEVEDDHPGDEDEEVENWEGEGGAAVDEETVEEHAGTASQLVDAKPHGDETDDASSSSGTPGDAKTVKAEEE